MCCHKRACPARVSAEVDRSTKVISKPTTPTEPHRWLHGGTGLKSPNVMVASRLLVGVGDALDSARANAELLGDLVQPWATRSSQCITDAPFQLGVDEGPTAVLATGLGPSNARIHPGKMGLEGIVSKWLGSRCLRPVEGLAEVQEPGRTGCEA